MVNNPIRFNDPTGHVCSDPDDPNRSCENGRSYPENVRALGNGHLNTIGDLLDDGLKQKKPKVYHRKTQHTPTTIQLAQDGISGLYLSVFPEGSSPSDYRTPQQLNSAEDWAAWGIFMDFLEGIAIAFPGDLFFGEYVISAGDSIITSRACYLYGECYVGQPDPSLPTMLVINQDMIITGTDLVAPVAGGLVTGAPTGGSGYYPGSVVTDIVTTGGSFYYDLGRITGAIPNHVSLGFTIKGDWYVLIYP